MSTPELRTELRGHTSVLNALRETQLDQGEQIASLRGEVRDGFEKMNVGMAQITALLTNKISDTDQ